MSGSCTDHVDPMSSGTQVLHVVFLVYFRRTQVIYISMNDLVIMKNELEGMWKEAIVAQYKVPSRYLRGVTEENHGNAYDCRSPGLDSRRAPPKHSCLADKVFKHTTETELWSSVMNQSRYRVSKSGRWRPLLCR
jgi:hypothetical protein